MQLVGQQAQSRCSGDSAFRAAVGWRERQELISRSPDTHRHGQTLHRNFLRSSPRIMVRILAVIVIVAAAAGSIFRVGRQGGKTHLKTKVGLMASSSTWLASRLMVFSYPPPCPARIVPRSRSGPHPLFGGRWRGMWVSNMRGVASSASDRWTKLRAGHAGMWSMGAPKSRGIFFAKDIVPFGGNGQSSNVRPREMRSRSSSTRLGASIMTRAWPPA